MVLHGGIKVFWNTTFFKTFDKEYIALEYF